MKKFVKWGLIVVVALVALFFVGGNFISRQWTVTETITIDAPNEVVYEQIANLKNWQNWSSWTKEKDETQVYTYEGPEMGTGAKWLWTSEKMGTGWLEIKDANVDRGIVYELFIDMGSMQSTLQGEIAIARMDGTLNVIWTDKGDSGSSLMKRWMSLMVKNMLGKEMREGLIKLKTITENKGEAKADVVENEAKPEAEKAEGDAADVKTEGDAANPEAKVEGANEAKVVEANADEAKAEEAKTEEAKAETK